MALVTCDFHTDCIVIYDNEKSEKCPMCAALIKADRDLQELIDSVQVE